MSEGQATPSLDLAYFRQRLLEEQAHLQEQLRKLEALDESASQSGELSDLADYDEHEADSGTETFMREKDMAVQRNLLYELHQIENALRRIQDGTYGICERCGRPIDPDRLDFLPYATLCVEDANRIEGQL